MDTVTAHKEARAYRTRRVAGGVVGEVGKLVAAGRTSDVYEFGSGVVVKVPRSGVPRHWAAKEARFARAVRELGAPAPEVVEVVQVRGRDAIVFERIDGRSMWDVICERPDEAARYGRELASVHQQVLSAGVPENVIGAAARMRAKLDDAHTLDEVQRLEARRTLEALPRGAALLHGDLHPGNVLMSPSGPVVIDWFDASVGHPVADVVRSSILIRPFEGRNGRPHLPGANAELLAELHDSYVAAMDDVLRRAALELRQWEAVVAASRLAEGAEADEAPLVGLWRDRHSPGLSALIQALSVSGRTVARGQHAP